MEYYQVIIYIYMVFALASSIVATVHYDKYKNTPLKYAPFILWLGIITEISGTLHNILISYYSGWIFNIYGFLFSALIFKMLYDYIESKPFKKIAFILSVTALLAYAIRFFTLESFNDRMIFIQGLHTLVFLALSLLCLIEILRSNRTMSIKESPGLFFIGGYLIFELIYTPLNIAFDMKLRLFSEDFYIFLKSIQGYFLIAIHSLFIFGFIWTKRARS